MDWLKNLSHTIEYIEKNLDSNISFDKCAEIACCSRFYFQRIFSYIFGVSLSQYIKQRRMTQAGYLIKRTDMKIIDIGLKYGYSSPSSFTRAFKSVHNITPIEARKPESILKSYPKIEFSIDIIGDEPVNYYIKNLSKFRILGRSIKLTNNVETNQKLVVKFWKKVLNSNIYNEILALNPKSKNIFGITEFKNPNEVYYHIGVISDQAKSEKNSQCLIKESSWVVFENHGNFKENIQDNFNFFYKEWLPFSGYSYGYLPDIEVYPIKKNSNPYGNSKVLISIKKEN